jgi:hypothetical protein
MRASFITGCLMTVCVVAAALPRAASAADLEGEDYAEAPYYDDDYSGAPPDGDRGHAYREGYDDAEPAPGSIKDGYPVPMPPPRASAPPPRYADRPPPRREHYACLEPWQIKRQLRGEGWSGIRPMGGDGSIVHIRARRFDSSSVFHLRVDRCSGEVIAARPHVHHYAYRDWRWDDRRW